MAVNCNCDRYGWLIYVYNTMLSKINGLLGRVWEIKILFGLGLGKLNEARLYMGRTWKCTNFVITVSSISPARTQILLRNLPAKSWPISAKYCSQVNSLIDPKNLSIFTAAYCYLLGLRQLLQVEGWEMNQKFGGGRQPKGTPSMAWSCAVVIVSLLSGASVVHNIFKPNLTLPPLQGVHRDHSKEPQEGWIRYAPSWSNCLAW